MTERIHETEAPAVSIVIVNFNGTRDTIDCMESLQHQTYPNTEIVVVDNASDHVDELEELLTPYSCHLVKLEQNHGFAAGNNAGVKYAITTLDPDYILMLNNDTVVGPNFITPLVNELKQNIGVGACCSHINYYSPPHLTWYGGGHINWKTGTSVHEKPNQNQSGSRDVDFLTGCAMLFPVTMIQDIGYLNEDYFLFYEDAEYSVKMKEAGYRLRYVPDSLVYHKISATAGFRSPLANYYGTRNKMYFMSLHSKRVDYALFLIYFTCKTAFKLMFYGFRGKRFKDLRQAIRSGYRDYFQQKTGKQEFLA